MRDAVGFFVAADQATDSSAVYAERVAISAGQLSQWTVGQRAHPSAHGQESMPVHMHSQLDEEVVNGVP
ncbi:hypothetical protein IVB03_22215 [Bradyrhizobium sp. 168]|uniref:hypothetical protein n=1 Tax=unclassified Bradyrhizobium TaxID=2631580 RepID=UPI001FF9C7F2|nr:MULTISPECIES: hypothetical protein [unclassified Bradyrhizobium]MCK1325250.1 hypothetical protein [Bradyrhizobium sp. 156]MCK1582209.1 hypothetical protein [Bradyrhizobium sp. 168]UPK10525.1 hypothetical protein IVA93_30290 [Bradyrhizobium sp. 155]